jgi:hypothetical protein
MGAPSPTDQLVNHGSRPAAESGPSPRGRAGAAHHRNTTDNSGERRSADRAGQQPFRSVRPGHAITRIVSRTEEARGSNPLTSTPNTAGQSVASVERATLSARSGRGATAAQVTVQPGGLSETRGDSVLGRTMTTQRGHRQLPTDGRSSPASRFSGWPPGRPGPLPTTAHDDDQVEADPPLAQHSLCQPRGPGSNLGQTTRRRGHGG